MGGEYGNGGYGKGGKDGPWGKGAGKGFPPSSPAPPSVSTEQETKIPGESGASDSGAGSTAFINTINGKPEAGMGRKDIAKKKESDVANSRTQPSTREAALSEGWKNEKAVTAQLNREIESLKAELASANVEVETLAQANEEMKTTFSQAEEARLGVSGLSLPPS